ncbi:MAG: HEAT repeat domain-containing protein [Planctomycetaceae bacterium]|nr:HEAT repeat domain-containing protein [Planctomycetaceae bacterium]
MTMSIEVHCAKQIPSKPNDIKRTTSRLAARLLPFTLLACCLFVNGCTTLEKTSASKFMAYMFNNKKDYVPGVITPAERIASIRLKAASGQNADRLEREVLLGQLLNEYRESPDPNIRREAIEAMALIPLGTRVISVKEGLTDSNESVRRSTCTVLANIAGEKGCSTADRNEILHALRSTMRNDKDKNMRILAMKAISPAARQIRITDGDKSEEYNRIVDELGVMLEDKTTSIRYEAMLSLQMVTGLDYGLDIDRWIGYTEYRKGEANEKPRERSWSEKLPQPQLPMLM